MSGITEIWQEIPDYPGHFASTLGRIKRVWPHKEVIYKPIETHDGYLTVGLKSKRLKIHRLVALTFIENKDNLPQINHIDMDKKNNSIYNLEWVNQNYNIQQAYSILGNYSVKGERHKHSKLTDAIIIEIKIRHKNGTSNVQLSKIFNVSAGTISDVICGKTWKHVK